MTTGNKLILTPIITLEENQQLVRKDETGEIYILAQVKTNIINKNPDFLKDTETYKTFIIEKTIKLKLLSVGVPAHLKGFGYLIDVLTEIYQLNQDKVKVKELYKKVAQKRNTYLEAVQRLIKSAIEQCEKNELYYKIFKTHKTVTNKNFLIAIASLVKNEISF